MKKKQISRVAQNSCFDAGPCRLVVYSRQHQCYFNYENNYLFTQLG